MSDTCFVIMPYGQKKDVDGESIDFDEIYEYIIKEAVNAVSGLECHRCDDFEAPGWIPERMIRHIAEDRVAVVDTSTLNANVFYELGVRHALRKSVTVLIRREGTSSPFNIAGLNAIEYSTNPKGVAKAKQRIVGAITSALQAPQNNDSLVYQVLQDLRVHVGADRAPKRLTKVDTFEYPLAQNTAKKLTLITGDREYINVGDVWVSSENTNMQMDRFYGASTSATIRYLGAKKNAAGNVVEDTIGEALAKGIAELGGVEVAPAAVLATRPGALEQNGVKWIFHVAAVKGEPREGYRPITQIERCVKNALKQAADAAYRDDRLSSIVFPIFGTGPGGGNLRDHAARLFTAAVEYLEAFPSHPVQTVYFHVWSDVDLEICKGLLREMPGVVTGTRPPGS